MVTVKLRRVIKKLISPAIIGLILLLFASSCGEVGIATLLSGGGISGTGRFFGIITGFGSVFVNGVEIETAGAQISIDDISSVEGDLKVGMKVQVEATDNVASSIVYKSEIKGQIESITTANNSFSVLGQTVIVDGTTVYEGQGLTGFAALQVDDIVEVSGFSDANANILASFVELEDSIPGQFKVIGSVKELDADNKTFKINNLTINYSGIALPDGVVNGTTVEVEGTTQGNIMTASEIEKEEISYDSGDEVEIEGVITSFTSQSDFVVNNQRVQTTSQTEYEHGTVINIAENVRVEVKGSVDSNNILIAEKVEFRFVESTSVEIKGAVQSVDTDNSTVTVFGITIHVDTNTGLKDESPQELRPFTLANIQIGDFLEIGGFVDDEGNIVAVKLERDEMPQQDELKLRGPVDSETPGNMTIEILGVSVNVSGAFDNINDASDFFSAIESGDIVKVKGSFLNNAFIAIEVDIELLI